MKIKDLPSLYRGWGNKFKKIFTILIIIIVVLTSLGIFILRDFGLGYKYYETNSIATIYIGATQTENFLEKTINEYIDSLNEQGYYIVSYTLNKIFIDSYTLIPKSTINEEDIKKVIINSLDISVLTTKLEIKDDETIYYFKTQEECDSFVETLNNYIEQEIISEGTTSSYKLITLKEVLDKKIEYVKNEKEKADAEKAAAAAAAQRKTTVTSRSGTTSREVSSYSGGAPMASYVYISSYYGTRWGRMHTGVDFAASAGTHIYAWKSGTVTFAGWSGGYGNFIIIDHGDGTVSRYGHCSGFAVSAGQTVVKGQTIGYVGTTGNSTGNHLHFEILVNGNFVNPLNYL